MQSTFQPLDGAHVSVVEGKFRVDGSVAGFVRNPGPKCAGAIDFPFGDWIGQLGVEGGGVIEAEIFDQNALDRKIARRLLGIVAENRDQAVGRANFFNKNGIFFGEVDVGALNSGASAAVFGRDVNLQAVELHIFNGVALAQDVRHAGREADALDLDQGRDVGAAFQPQE